MREAIAAKILTFRYITSKENYADVMTKPLGFQDFYNLVKPCLFRVPKWGTYALKIFLWIDKRFWHRELDVGMCVYFKCESELIPNVICVSFINNKC